MQNILLSVIVPIYGVEKYINRFLESMKKNFHPQVEFILVDDGSKDNCGKIIDEFKNNEAKNENITIIHKENGGVSSARNVGISAAQGKYILCADPDDYLNEDYVENILNMIEENNDVNMIIFDYYEENNDGKFYLHHVPDFQAGFINQEKLLEELILDKNLLSHMVNKILRKTLFEKIKFKEEISFLEDYAFMTEVSLNIKSIYYKPVPIYYYCYNDSGLSKVPAVNDKIKAFYIIKERYDKYTKVLNKKLYNAPAVQAIDLICLKYRNNMQFNIDELKKYINNNIKNILLDKEIKINVKKQCLFVYFGIAKWYFSLKRK